VTNLEPNYADPSPPFNAVGHERVELYLYSPLWALRPVQSLSACTSVTFIFTFLNRRKGKSSRRPTRSIVFLQVHCSDWLL